MKIYLGLPGSEQLLTDHDRSFSMESQEDCEDVITENGATHRYTNDNIKNYFSFSYSHIDKSDLDVIENEYNRKTVLNLKIEKDINSSTYDTYNVLFEDKISKGMGRDYPSFREYKNVSFTLREA